MNHVIQPGLDRIAQLLKGTTEFPWKAIHVAGTNGKGSICHYAAALLRRRAIRAGKFSTPHLVNRWDSIMINHAPVEELDFKKVENHFIQLNQANNVGASPFEIMTATAFTMFNDAKVKVGVIEVGMGGSLDATNILNNQAVSVISKIARDHESFLGNTIADIAKHKAGILRPNVPYIVNPENEANVQAVIDDYAREIGAGPRLYGDTPRLRKDLYSRDDWRFFAEPIQPFQRDNAVLAIVAVKEVMKAFGGITDELIANELGKVRFGRFPGRLQIMQVIPVFGWERNTGRSIIVDGAHNKDAAFALNEFVARKGRKKWKNDITPPPAGGWPVTWVLAMTEGKDAEGYLEVLLRPGDKVITTSFGPVDGMPWVQSMEPQALLKIAQKVQPDITGLAIPDRSALRALCAAKFLTNYDYPIVMTGSLYLMGDLHRELEGKSDQGFWHRYPWADEREKMIAMLDEERERISRFKHMQDPDEVEIKLQPSDILSPDRRKHELKAELEALQQELNLLKIENQKAAGQKPIVPGREDADSLGASTVASPDFKKRFTDLRARERRLRDEALTYGAEGEAMLKRRGPRFHMHFGNNRTDDRRDIRRPTFLADKKFGA
ncbi:Mur ligase [Phaeosphaeria sp. MPI-PUGE-AT-0046c]|nr:Mur ligase [Phaeosphaeria sp. MPI-PUGE-AT-0046c]